MDIPYTRSKNGILIKIKVDTKTSKSCLSDIFSDYIKIKLHSPPVDGEANKELIEILSNLFNVKKSSIKIIKGKSSKDKLIEIVGISSLSLGKEKIGA